MIAQLTKLYSKLIDRNIDPIKEILVSIGAYQSLYCAIMAFVNPGDEVRSLFDSPKVCYVSISCFQTKLFLLISHVGLDGMLLYYVTLQGLVEELSQNSYVLYIILHPRFY